MPPRPISKISEGKHAHFFSQKRKLGVGRLTGNNRRGRAGHCLAGEGVLNLMKPMVALLIIGSRR